MFNPYAPPRGRNAIVASLATDRDDLPPLESLNPDNLKDLSKDVLSELLKAHNILPGGSKPEMKKQVRTLIHSITNNTPIPTSINMPKVEMGSQQHLQQQFSQQLQAVQQAHQQQQQQQHDLLASVQPQMMNPLALPFQPQYNPLSFVPQTAAPPPPYLVTSPLMSPHHPQLSQLPPHHHLLQQPHMSHPQPPPPMSYPLSSPIQVAQPAPSIAAPPTPQPPERHERASAKAAKDTPTATSPPTSPKPHHEESDTCKDCTKKANKECTNHRCRGCCIKYMMESKELCLIHIKDESRRPRTKEHPNAELQALIAQAQATFPGFSVSSSNTPATSTPTIAASTPNSSSAPAEPLSLGVSPLMIGGKPHHLAPPPPIQKAQSNIAMPAVPTGALQANAANTAQQLASTHKVQTQLQMQFVSAAAHYAQQIAYHRMTLRKEDQFAFYSCPRCDKVLGVNGSQLWRHVQSEHPELFVPLLKQNIYNGGLVGDQSDILSLSKEAAQDRINTTAQWLKELYSPSTINLDNSTDIMNNNNDRLEKIKEYQSKLESLVRSFDNRITTTLDSIQSDSGLFYQYYNQLSDINSIEDLEKLRIHYEKVKGIHFEPKPLIVTLTIPQQQQQQQQQQGVNNDIIIQQL